MRRRFQRLVPILLTAFLSACGARRVVQEGVVHEVRPGETLSLIGLAYSVPYQEIARANRLRDPSLIRVGQRLVIPGAERPIEVTPHRARPVFLLPRRSDRERLRTARLTERPADAPRLRWPLSSGRVTSGFGPRDGNFHDGIDIAAPVGAPIRAAADGEVAYSDRLGGYGRMIALRHGRGYVTIYAHNERNLVRVGQTVRKGDLIATVGRSGRTSGPNLHFEVRKDNVAHDPRPFLPAIQRASSDRGAADGG